MTHPLIPILLGQGLGLGAASVLAGAFESLEEFDGWIQRTSGGMRDVELRRTPRCGPSRRAEIHRFIEARIETMSFTPAIMPTTPIALLREALVVCNTIPSRSVPGLACGTTHNLATAITRCLAEEGSSWALI